MSRSAADPPLGGRADRARTASGWEATMYRSFSAFLHALVLGAPRSALHESEGLLATVVPRAPENSFFNSVIYEHPDALAGGLEGLAARYAGEGIKAWTVWVPEADAESAALLESAGHRLDAAPEAMVLNLSEIPDIPLGDLDWNRNAPIEDVARINDVAYGYETGPFVHAIAATPPGTYWTYEARVDGTSAAVLGTLDHEGDCALLWVATLPAAQGRGLAKRLLRQALADARERGCATATLQATKAGQPLYSHVGFSPIGALQMWESRG